MRIRFIGVSLLAACVLAPVAVAQVSYQTGTIAGTVLLSDAAPVPSALVRAEALDGVGTVETTIDETGAYHLLVPVGVYRVTATYEMGAINPSRANRIIGSTDVAVTEGNTATASFTFLAGTVRTTVVRDGEAPAGVARLEIGGAAPATCAEGDTCHWTSGDGLSCHCVADDVDFMCLSDRGCFLLDAEPFNAWTDGSGVAEKLVPPGSFDVRVLSASEPNQWGEVQVGTLRAVVADAVTTDVGAISYLTGTVGGQVLAGGAPVASAHIEARTYSMAIRTATDASGRYSLVLPEGTYDVVALMRNAPDADEIGRQLVTVTGGVAQAVDFAGAEAPGTLTGEIVADGAAVDEGWVHLSLHAPATCAEGDFCHWVSTDGLSCHCVSGSEEFLCIPDYGGCRNISSPGYWGFTDPAGRFRVPAPSGAYDVDIYSGREPEQEGRVRIASLVASVNAGLATDVGTISYGTGLVAGTTTTCGQPLSDAWITATVPSVWQQSPIGSVRKRVDGSGAYTLRVPVGPYEMSARWPIDTVVATGSVAVTEAQTAEFAAVYDLGQLRGLITQDGQPAAGAAAEIHRPGPASCSEGDFCHWVDGSSCHCELGGEEFLCIEEFGGCRFLSEVPQWAYTGSDGFFTRMLPAGAYAVEAYSAEIDGQVGRIRVGTIPVAVASCQLTEVGASLAAVDPGTNVLAELGDLVTLLFDSVESAGAVTYLATSTPQGPPAPSGSISFVGLYYDFVVSAAFSGPVEVCLPYDVEEVPEGTELALFHNELGTGWVDITTQVDIEAHLVCGATATFSYFVLGAIADRGAVPFADAGPDQAIPADAACLAWVMLDAGGSYDEDGDHLTFTWRHGGALVGEGGVVTVALAPGTQVFELQAADPSGAVGHDTVQVTVADMTPPDLSVVLSPARIWPPDGRMVQVTPAITVRDNCDVAPQVALVSVGAEGAPLSDAGIDGLGAVVRAYRDGGDRNGRTYVLDYVASDVSGNAASLPAVVTVPHDRR